MNMMLNGTDTEPDLDSMINKRMLMLGDDNVVDGLAPLDSSRNVRTLLPEYELQEFDIGTGLRSRIIEAKLVIKLNDFVFLNRKRNKYGLCPVCSRKNCLIFCIQMKPNYHKVKQA